MTRTVASRRGGALPRSDAWRGTARHTRCARSQPSFAEEEAAEAAAAAEAEVAAERLADEVAEVHSMQT